MQTEFTTGGLITYYLGTALIFTVIGAIGGYKSVANSLQRRLPGGWQVLNVLTIWVTIAIGQQIATILIPRDGPGIIIETAVNWAGCLIIGAAISALYLTSKGQPLVDASTGTTQTETPTGNSDA